MEIILADPLIPCVVSAWLTMISTTAVAGSSVQAQSHLVMIADYLKYTLPIVLTKTFSNTKKLSHVSTVPRGNLQPRQDRSQQVQVDNSKWYSAGFGEGSGRFQPPLFLKATLIMCPLMALLLLCSTPAHSLALASQNHCENKIPTPKSLSQALFYWQTIFLRYQIPPAFLNRMWNTILPPNTIMSKNLHSNYEYQWLSCGA